MPFAQLLEYRVIRNNSENLFAIRCNLTQDEFDFVLEGWSNKRKMLTANSLVVYINRRRVFGYDAELIHDFSDN